MKSKAEVVELRQPNQEPSEVDREWLEDKENEIWERLRRKKEELWEIGRVLYEVREKYAYKEGYMKWLKKFRRELPYRTAYDYMRIYICCPTKEHVQYFPLKFLRKMCRKTFNEKLRKWLFDNRESFNDGLTDEEFDQIVENITEEDFDPLNPELEMLLKIRGDNLDGLHYSDRVKKTAEYKQSKHDEWMAAANSRWPTDEDGKVKFPKKLMDDMPIFGILRDQGLLPPEYEVVD